MQKDKKNRGGGEKERGEREKGRKGEWERGRVGERDAQSAGHRAPVFGTIFATDSAKGSSSKKAKVVNESYC